MRRTLALLALGGFLTLGATASAATLGPRISLDLEGDDTDVGIGVEMRFEVARLGAAVGLQLRPGFDWFIIEDARLFDLSFDMVFAFDVRSAVIEPYAGLGVGIWFFNPDGPGDGDSDGFLNIFGGAKFLPMGAVQPFIEIKAAVGDGPDPTLLILGILFQI